MDTLFLILNIILAPITAYLLGMFYYGLYRRLTARVQRRWGPTVLQTFYDNIKLFSKREAASHGLMFHLGPIIMATGSVTTILFIPFFRDSAWLQGFSKYGNFILITYLMTIGPLGNALAVGVGGVPFGAMGVTRGLTRMIGIETPFFLAAGILMAKYHTVSVNSIALAQDTGFFSWNIFRFPLIFIIALFTFVAGNSSPFDVVAAPTEVYSGPRSEFSGKYLGILMAQRMIFSVAKLILFVNLFMGGAANLFELIWKTFAFFMFQAIFGMVFPRFKTEQAVDFLWKIPTAIGLIAIIIEFYLR